MISLVDASCDRRSFLSRLGKGIGGMSLLPFLDKDLAACNLHDFARGVSNWSHDDTTAAAHDEAFWRFVRAQFLLSDERTYFNNGGLGPSPRVVVDAVLEASKRLERISETGHEELKELRKKAAFFLGCDPDEIAFTRNTTEGMNIIARGLPLEPGDEVLMSTHEHVGGSMPWLALAKDTGVKVRLFEPGRSREENLRIVERALQKQTKVLSLSHITCTTGTVFPVEEITELCHSQGILVVYDGAHPPGMIRVDLHRIGCDFYATSGHKWLLGPKGTGLLYVKRDMHNIWHPTFAGAYSSDDFSLDDLHFSFRKVAAATEYGTRNIPLVHGLVAAISFLQAIGMDRVEARDRSLATYLYAQLTKFPEVVLLTPEEPASRAGMVAFRHRRIPYGEIIRQLGEAGFRVRPVGEHKLQAIRVSTHVYSTFAEIDRFLSALRRILTA